MRQRSAVVFLLSFGWLLALLLAQWPGNLTYDSYNYLFSALHDGQLLNYESSLYGALLYYTVRWGYGLLPSFLILFTLVASSLAYLERLVRERLGMPKLALAAVAAALLYPPNLFYAALSERDVFFGWLCLLAILLLADLLTWPGSQGRKLLLLALVITLATGVRREGVAVGLGAFLALAAARRPEKVVFAGALAALLGAYAWTVSVLSPTPEQFQLEDRYHFNALAEPLFYIVQNLGRKLTTEEEKTISAIFPPTEITGLEVAKDSMDFTRLNWSATKEERRAFFLLSLRLIAERPGVFLHLKWLYLKDQMLDPVLVTFPSDSVNIRPEWRDFFARHPELIQPASKIPLLARVVQGLLDWTERHQVRRTLLVGPLPAAALLFLTLLLFPWVPRAAQVSLPAACHFAAVTLSQPVGNIKYLYFTSLFAFALVPFLARKRQKNALH